MTNSEKELLKKAASLHQNVPPDWYYTSIKKNIGQKYWHTRRFQEVQKLIEPTKGKILDIGCADGVFTKVIVDKAKPSKVIGIDALSTSVKWANNHWKKNKKMSFKVGDAHKLNFKNETFEAVFALEVLEHVYKPKTVLKEVKRVLVKGGYAVFLVPTDSKLFNVIWGIWTKLKGKIWDDCHVQSFKDDSLVKIAKEVGFEIEVNKKFLLGMLQAIKVRKR